MNRPVLVSVIIPCYNVEEYIEECLDSVYNQTYAYIEVIVVDNNSTDGTVSIVEEYRARKNVELSIHQEKNQGSSYARNTGMYVAKGEWIQFLDADDLLLPEKIEHQVGLIQKDLDLITAATIERRVDGSEVFMVPHENVIFGLIAGYRNVGSTCSNLWKKSTLLKLDGFDSELKASEEIDLIFRMYINEAVFIKDLYALTIIRARKRGQVSQGNKEKLAYNWLRVRVKQLDWFFVKQRTKLNTDLMLALLKRFLINIHYQDISHRLLSHNQYHDYIIPIFRPYIKYLTLHERLKQYLYLSFGFKRVRALVELIK